MFIFWLFLWCVLGVDHTHTRDQIFPEQQATYRHTTIMALVYGTGVNVVVSIPQGFGSLRWDLESTMEP